MTPSKKIAFIPFLWHAYEGAGIGLGLQNVATNKVSIVPDLIKLTVYLGG